MGVAVKLVARLAARCARRGVLAWAFGGTARHAEYSVGYTKGGAEVPLAMK